MNFYDKSVKLYENKKIKQRKKEKSSDYQTEIGGLKKEQSPCKILGFEKRRKSF